MALKNLARRGPPPRLPSIREQVAAAIATMDGNIDETDTAWGHAAFLIAAFILGPDPQAIADKMEFDPITVEVWAERARNSGIWKDGKTSVDDYAGEEDGVKFWLDCAVIGGSIKKVGDDRYQTPQGKALIAKLSRSKKKR